MNRYVSTALATFAASAVAMGAGPAPAANATCVSAFGFGNSSHCTSSPTTIAIAIGANAEAHGVGTLGAAIALGNNTFAGFYGSLGFASVLGTSSSAVAANLGIAIAAGSHSAAHAGAAPTHVFNVAVSIANDSDADTSGQGNVAVNLFGSGSTVRAFGTGDLALNTGNNSTVAAWGTLSNALNLGGYQVFVGTGGSSRASSAVNIMGAGNAVQAQTGPFAVAGSIFQTGASISQAGPGVHINGVKAGSAAAIGPAAAQRSAKGVGATKRKH
ncbi:hypothetical protein ACTXG7_10535 [Mycolicibacterium sp. Dal123E01]|uniref:hypothetical protein n=1 Tax=Mycolicibacterium sp. Dal123E01 TaxID=3457578 RepID=UPI00403EEA1C